MSITEKTQKLLERKATQGEQEPKKVPIKQLKNNAEFFDQVNKPCTESRQNKRISRLVKRLSAVTVGDELPLSETDSDSEPMESGMNIFEEFAFDVQLWLEKNVSAEKLIKMGIIYWKFHSKLAALGCVKKRYMVNQIIPEKAQELAMEGSEKILKVSSESKEFLEKNEKASILLEKSNESFKKIHF